MCVPHSCHHLRLLFSLPQYADTDSKASSVFVTLFEYTPPASHSACSFLWLDFVEFFTKVLTTSVRSWELSSWFREDKTGKWTKLRVQTWASRGISGIFSQSGKHYVLRNLRKNGKLSFSSSSDKTAEVVVEACKVKGIGIKNYASHKNSVVSRNPFSFSRIKRFLGLLHCFKYFLRLFTSFNLLKRSSTKKAVYEKVTTLQHKNVILCEGVVKIIF